MHELSPLRIRELSACTETYSSAVTEFADSQRAAFVAKEKAERERVQAEQRAQQEAWEQRRRAARNQPYKGTAP